MGPNLDTLHDVAAQYAVETSAEVATTEEMLFHLLVDVAKAYEASIANSAASPREILLKGLQENLELED